MSTTSMKLISALATLVAIPFAKASFGSAFSTGPTAPGNFIRTANSTLIVPQPPTPRNSMISLWVGMGTSNGDLIQALTESYSGDQDYDCGALTGSQWCNWASTLNGSGQVGGHQKIANAGDRVKMSYILNDATGNYDQYVYINDVLASSFTTSSGRALGWGTAEECQPEGPCGLMTQHTWVDTIIVLDRPQPDYNNTFGWNNAKGEMTTCTGGLVWQAPKLTIGANNFGPSCPDWDKQNVTLPAGTEFNVECGIGRQGGDIKSIKTNNFMACLEACEKTRSCAQVVMKGGTCTLKSKRGAGVVSSGAIGAHVISR